MRTKLPLFFLCMFIMISASGSVYEIYKDNGSYQVRDRISLKVIKKEKSASLAIQFAIDNTNESATITILPGTFSLDKPIRMTSGLTLKGMGPATVLQISANNQEGMAIKGDSINRAVISDLSIKGGNIPSAKTGIVLSDCGDCVVKDVYCSGLQEYGIWLKDQSFLSEIRGCKIAGAGKAGIFLDNLDGGGRGGDFVPNLVTNCIIYGGNTGILCSHSIVINIVACEVYQTAGIGFHITENSNSVLISGCRTFQIRNDAVVVQDSHEININGNIFCWHDGHGIVLENSSWGSVSGNNIIDTGHYQIDAGENEEWTYWVKRPENFDFAANTKNGIMMTNGTQGITVNGNAIFNWGSNPPLRYGIEEDNSCQNNLISGNNINYCLLAGIQSEGKNTMVETNFVNIETPYHGDDSIELDRFHRYEKSRIQDFIDALE